MEEFRFNGNVYLIPSCWTVVMIDGIRYRRGVDAWTVSRWVRAS